MHGNPIGRAALGGAWNPKVAGIAVLVLVFLCGMATGAVAMHLGWHNYLHQPSFDSPAGRALNWI
jgi:hypothetical protein